MKTSDPLTRTYIWMRYCSGVRTTRWNMMRPVTNTLRAKPRSKIQNVKPMSAGMAEMNAIVLSNIIETYVGRVWGKYCGKKAKYSRAVAWIKHRTRRK